MTTENKAYQHKESNCSVRTPWGSWHYLMAVFCFLLTCASPMAQPHLEITDPQAKTLDDKNQQEWDAYFRASIGQGTTWTRGTKPPPRHIAPTPPPIDGSHIPKSIEYSPKQQVPAPNTQVTPKPQPHVSPPPSSPPPDSHPVTNTPSPISSRDYSQPSDFAPDQPRSDHSNQPSASGPEKTETGPNDIAPEIAQGVAEMGLDIVGQIRDEVAEGYASSITADEAVSNAGSNYIADTIKNALQDALIKAGDFSRWTRFQMNLLLSVPPGSERAMDSFFEDVMPTPEDLNGTGRYEEKY